MAFSKVSPCSLWMLRAYPRMMESMVPENYILLENHILDKLAQTWECSEGMGDGCSLVWLIIQQSSYVWRLHMLSDLSSKSTMLFLFPNSNWENLFRCEQVESVPYNVQLLFASFSCSRGSNHNNYRTKSTVGGDYIYFKNHNFSTITFYK